jgi:hypothetical protein
VATFLHSGDFGDALYALPSVSALGGGTLYFASRPWTRTRWTPQLLAIIKPLIDRTGFCEALLHDGEWIDHDFSTFRNGGYRLGDTIMERQRRWVGAERWDGKPWLNALPAKPGRIVINRASRWHGWHFPYGKILQVFPKDIVFIGLSDEHAAFEKEFGFVPFYWTKDLLEAAGVIAGAELFIGNQSACLAIANGLGRPVVVEVCPYACDCFYKRQDAFYSFNGEVSFKGFETLPFHGRFETEVGGRKLSSDDPDKLKVIARSVHAHDGTFAYYDEVALH